MTTVRKAYEKHKPPKSNADLSPEEREQIQKELDKSVKIKEVLKNTDYIHPGGMAIKDFVIEPIANGRYVYNVYGTIGIVKAERDYEHDNKNKWIVEIEGEKIEIKGTPLNDSELIFNLPDKDLVYKFVKGKIKPLSTVELYIKARDYFKQFLDLNDPAYYDGLVLGVFQSWLVDVLNSVFFFSIQGEFGGGKTTVLEAIKNLSRHGYMPNPSVSFIGRCIDRLRITPFIDEFDIMGERDNELYMLVRTCQRRGQRFTRMADKGQRIESFDTFGMVGFTVHGGIEDALQTRSLAVYTSETTNPMLPRIGNIRNILGNKLYTQFFIWYIRKMIDIYDRYVTHVTHVTTILDNINNDMTAVTTNKELMGLLSIDYTVNPKTPVTPVTPVTKNVSMGRNAELEQSMLLLMKFTGLLEPVTDGVTTDFTSNILNSVQRLLTIKEELRAEMRETGLLGLLRDWLVSFYKKNRLNQEMRTKEGLFIGSNQDIYDGFTAFAKNKGYHQMIGGGQYKGLMRDIGFVSGSSNKRMRVYCLEEGEKKSRSAYIYDERVQRNLGIKIVPVNEPTVFEAYQDEGVREVTGVVEDDGVITND